VALRVYTSDGHEKSGLWLPPQRSAALPANPQEGQEVYLKPPFSGLGVVGDGVFWQMVRDGGRWCFLGGGWIRCDLGTRRGGGSATTVTTLSPTWQDLAEGSTFGITAPYAGDYVVMAESSIDNAADGQQTSLGVKPGAGTTVEIQNHRTGNWTDDKREMTFAGVAASALLKPQARTTSSGGRILNGALYLRPHTLV
jgi:hypothetical protein